MSDMCCERAAPTPSNPDVLLRTGGSVRRGLPADVKRVVALAVSMCGGAVPGEAVDEWQAWVRAVGREMLAHIKARKELLDDLAVAVRALNDFAAWNEGPVVKPHFEHPGIAREARAALKRIKNRGIVQP